MRLSIGVPTYNQAAFLGETLTSLLEQQEPFAEIVVSENHCTDATAAVLEKFAGRVRVVRPPTHLSMVENWNFTVSQMTGDWISLLSSDDLALPNFAADVRRTVEEVADAVLLRAAWIDMAADGVAREERHLNVRRVTLPGRALYEQRLGPRGSFAAFAMRHDIWRQAGGFPEEVSLLGDWGMWLLAGALGKTVYCDRPLAKYRAGHQENELRRRRHIHAREMFTMYDVILPRAAALAGLGRPAWIDAASRRQFRTWVADASRDFAPQQRALLVEALRPWAAAVHEYPLLDRFIAGQVLRTGRFSQRAAAAVRPLARRLLRVGRSAREFALGRKQRG